MLTTAEIVAARFARSSSISAVASLPLALAGLIDTEIIELLRFAGLTP